MITREKKVLEVTEYLTQLSAVLTKSDDIVLLDQSFTAQALELRDKAERVVKDITESEKKRFKSIRQLKYAKDNTQTE